MYKVLNVWFIIWKIDVWNQNLEKFFFGSFLGFLNSLPTFLNSSSGSTRTILRMKYHLVQWRRDLYSWILPIHSTIFSLLELSTLLLGSSQTSSFTRKYLIILNSTWTGFNGTARTCWTMFRRINNVSFMDHLFQVESCSELLDYPSG